MTPWTVACQAFLSVGFSRQEYWSELPLPYPGDLPDPETEPGSPTLQADSLLSEPPRKPPLHYWWKYKMIPPCWKTVWQFFRRFIIELSCDLAIVLLSIVRKRSENRFSYAREVRTGSYTSICSNVIHNSQKVQTSQMSIS